MIKYFVVIISIVTLVISVDADAVQKKKSQKKSTTNAEKTIEKPADEAAYPNDEGDDDAGSIDSNAVNTPVNSGNTAAAYAYMIDYDTGSVLLDKNANELMHPASMTKLMTAYLIFEKLKDGSLTLDDKFMVSVKAWRTGGSKMFVKEGDEVAVRDLIRGIIVDSGNDACIVMAEGISGSEEAFVDDMNAKAKEIGMNNTHFVNTTGLPNAEHLTTAKDLAILAQNLIKNFPEYYPIYSTKGYTYSNIKQYNRNLLLSRSIGADGMKTGYTEQSGYGMVASAKQDGRRIIAVVNGLNSGRQRAAEAERLLRTGFRETKNVTLFKKGEVVESAELWMGNQKTVPLIINDEIKYTVTRSNKNNNQEILVSYDGPISAPVKKGDHIADLIVKKNGEESVRLPLYAGKNVEKKSAMGQFFTKLKYYFAS